MKKIICLATVLLMLVLFSASAVAEQVLSTATGNQNVPFSNGYAGFCLDPLLHGAYPNDVFTPAPDTSAATTNLSDNADISQKLKVLFTQCFEDIFASDGSGSYVLTDANTIQGVTYHFTDNQYVWGAQLSLVNQVNAYTGPAIPDHGYQLTLDNGDVIEFDFMVLIPENAGTQYFFAYRITTNPDNSGSEPPQAAPSTVTFDSAGGTAVAPQTIENGTTARKPEDPTKEGFTFEGWTLEGIEYDFSTPVTTDITLIANWKEIPQTVTWTVSFDANGGDGTMAPQTFIEGTAQELYANAFTRTGYTFEGWNTAADGSGTSYADGENVTATSNTTLYAQWQKVPEEILPEITRQPEDAYVVEGQRAEFSIEATGDELSYQWYINRNDGNGWKELEGAIGTEYTSSVTDLECDGFRYGCLITDKHGNTLKSNVVVLNVFRAPILPETGDSSTPLLWLAMSILSMGGILLLRRKACSK